MYEDVEVTFKRPGGSRSYKLRGKGGHTAEMIVQLLNLGNVDSLRLEPVHLALPGHARVKTRVDAERSNKPCTEDD